MNPNDYPELSPKTIWNFRQNHPELVIRDLRDYLGLNEEQLEFVRRVMLARGVNKWLKVRRDLIAYKKIIKHQIKQVEKERAALDKGDPKRRLLLAQSKILQDVRANLKSLCMTDRWQIWPSNRPVSSGIRSMNTIKASDEVKL
jgi:hypothetical protein